MAITMCIGTILKADRVLLLPSREGKAAAAAAMIEGPLSSSCPASALQMHWKAVVLLDEAAASRPILRDHCDCVHPDGREDEI